MERRERERGGRERREVGLANSVANANGQDGTLSLSLSTVNPEEHRERGRGELRAGPRAGQLSKLQMQIVIVIVSGRERA